jgi:hypothetical protein
LSRAALARKIDDTILIALKKELGDEHPLFKLSPRDQIKELKRGTLSSMLHTNLLHAPCAGPKQLKD